MCNGDFLQKDPDEVIEYLDNLAEKAHIWTGPNVSDLNFSWKSENQQHAQQTRAYNAPSRQPMSSRNSLEDTLHAFIEGQGKTNKKFETMIAQVVEENKEIKNHMSKLTNALSVGKRGKFPAQAQQNPKGQHMAQTSRSKETNFKEVNAITTRSGKVVKPTPPPRENRKEPSEPNESSPSEEVVENLARIPFPQALKSILKSTGQHNEILEHLRQVKIKLLLIVEMEEASTIVDSNSLNSFLLNSEISCDFDVDEYANICAIFAKLHDHRTSPWQPKFEELPERIRGQKPSSIESPRPELKQLSIGLKHVFLGPGDTFPLIISSELDALQCKQLLNILNEHKSALGWTIANIKGISPLICSHRIHLEEGANPRRDSQLRLNPTMKEVVKNKVLKLLDAGIIYPIVDSKYRMCIDYRKLNAATHKNHFSLPFLDQILERVVGHPFYYFLDGYLGYYQIEIALEDQEKTTFTCPFGTYAFHRMSFGLYNAPATFQRCMMNMFSDMVDDCMEVFMDDLTVFGTSFDACLSNLKRVLARCEEKGLVLN
ncbi:uncharacterized protein LOC111406658 [Olea europaea var. sylvestris]|uniref:uncharacterized protein LOC111406658 n=1 Tax=Olea europaea var. sylvestris TaxID=158386 RepID=UPI000C1CD523|nr:uncharacterized protein LOC111406658 [Olea europaea var. sylvestris]